MAHYEDQYLDLMRRIWTQGAVQQDRTGVGTRSLFGATMRFSLADNNVPLLTTKRIFWKTAAREMLWFLTGDTNIRTLLQQKVRIWTDWPLQRYRQEAGEAISQEEFEQRIVDDADFAEKWGDLGPVYGAQWVNWPRYEAADVAELDRMALPPCHKTYQFHVADGVLSGLLFQRSCDLGLGFGFNVFAASMLIRMLAQQCGYEPGELIWQGGDVHLYMNHGELVEEQLSRKPHGAPKLHLLRRPESIFAYEIEDFEVLDYQPQAHIAAPVAV
ncbi:MAG: thymidylate synthase [Sphingomonadales bacterium]|nr:thymidylate synthase [Sphingomonadales bacterium]